MSDSTLQAAPLAAALAAIAVAACSGPGIGGPFEGRFYVGRGDVEYLQLLDISRRMFDADGEFQNAAMLYTPAWDGFVEGPTWGAWWIQNSYGPTYCALPFYTEPYVTFLQNAQDLWFDHIGDGKRMFKWRSFQWRVPDGQLCDAAAPGCGATTSTPPPTRHDPITSRRRPIRSDNSPPTRPASAANPRNPLSTSPPLSSAHPCERA